MKVTVRRLVLVLSLLGASVMLLGNGQDGGCGSPYTSEQLCYQTAGSWNGVTCVCPVDTSWWNGIGCRYNSHYTPIYVDPYPDYYYYDDYYYDDYYYDDYYYDDYYYDDYDPYYYDDYDYGDYYDDYDYGDYYDPYY